jgi:hypothetical protein
MVASQSGSDDLVTAKAYEASAYDQRYLLDGKVDDKVQTNSWMQSAQLNAIAASNMPGCIVAVPQLAGLDTPMAALFREFNAPFPSVCTVKCW